jgi:hypothetical protein
MLTASERVPLAAKAKGYKTFSYFFFVVYVTLL